MFREWGFLLGEIWVLLALAALIGLIAGWIIWGRRSEVNIDTSEADGLRADLNACRKSGAEKDATIGGLRADLDACRDAQMSEPEPAPVAALDGDFDGDGVVEGDDEGSKPTTLDAPRDGVADDLKRTKGIGPKMEKLCNELGFWHFDQISAWSTQEVAWVDANLQGFKGRVTRDEWVSQAKLLAEGGETEFSQKVDKGDIY